MILALAGSILGGLILKPLIGICPAGYASDTTVACGTRGILKWDKWFLRGLIIDCSMILDNLNGNDEWTIPDPRYHPDERIKVRAHGFYWYYAQHHDGRDTVVFTPPQNNLGGYVTSGERPVGHSYKVTLRGSWHGIPVFKAMWMVNALCAGTEHESFNCEEYHAPLTL